MKKWHLHTTGDNFEQEVKELLKLRRTFVWSHVSSPEQREERIRYCEERGLMVLNTVPIWFLVICGTTTAAEPRRRMARCILDGAQLGNARWMGQMFSYTQEEIDWYTTEVQAAWRRFYEVHGL